MTLLFLGIALGLSLAAGRSIWKQGDEETRVRCWTCGRTFSKQEGLTWHATASHPYDDSGVYDGKGRLYR